MQAAQHAGWHTKFYLFSIHIDKKIDESCEHEEGFEQQAETNQVLEEEDYDPTLHFTSGNAILGNATARGAVKSSNSHPDSATILHEIAGNTKGSAKKSGCCPGGAAILNATSGNAGRSAKIFESRPNGATTLHEFSGNAKGPAKNSKSHPDGATPDSHPDGATTLYDT